MTTVADYLNRIGVAAATPDIAELRELQSRHLATVPFENLSIHSGEDIVLDEGALVDKVVVLQRGGICYELNGAFAWLLERLGYRVTRLAARVNGANGPGPLFDHMVLRVDLDDPWLIDVGFGRFSRYPLRFDSRETQDDPTGTYRLAETTQGDIEVHHDEQLAMVIETRPRELDDFVPTCWYHQTSPQSPFTKSPTCSLPTVDGRITLSGDEIIRTIGKEKHTEKLGSDTEILTAYRQHFGIALDRVPNDPRTAG